MANLKDINYGIGKYLEASDASAIPDIGTNRKNLDLLNFKVATNNAYDLYNFKDGMIDAYQTQAGVDTTASTNETYDSTNKLYSPTIIAAATTAFTSTGAATYTCPAGITQAEILIVAGGGGGADSTGAANAGAGAGGYRESPGTASGCYTASPLGTSPAVALPVSVQGYAVAVGGGGAGGFPDSTTSEWNRVINVNLNGTFYVSRAVWPHLIAAGGGAVVNMSSLAAQRGFSPKMHHEFGTTAPSY